MLGIMEITHTYTCPRFRNNLKENYDPNIVIPPTTKYPNQYPNKNVVNGVDTYLNVCKLVQPRHQDQHILLPCCLCKGYEHFTWMY